MLIGLGLAPAEADAIVFMPLAELPQALEGTIFSRLQPVQRRSRARSRPDPSP